MRFFCQNPRDRPGFSVRELAYVVCVSAALLCSGCALHHGDFALDGKLCIDLSPPKGPLFYGVQVAQYENELVVSGFGRRPEPGGHIDIAVMGPDGGTLAETRTEALPPRAVPKRTYNYRFKTSVPLTPPAGSTLRVTYVRSSPGAKKTELRGRQRAPFVSAGPLTGTEIAD